MCGTPNTFMYAFAIALGGVAALVILGSKMTIVSVDVVLFTNKTYGVRRSTRVVNVGKYLAHILSFGLLHIEAPSYKYLTRVDLSGVHEWMMHSNCTNEWREFPTKEAAELALYAVNKFGERDAGVAIRAKKCMEDYK